MKAWKDFFTRKSEDKSHAPEELTIGDKPVKKAMEGTYLHKTGYYNRKMIRDHIHSRRKRCKRKRKK